MSRFAEQSASPDSTMVLLTMLSDPEGLRTRLEELRRLEQSANERIALAGVADEIVAIRQDVARLQHEASQALVDAENQAKQIMEKAQSDATVIRKNAQKYYDDTVCECESLLSEAKEDIKTHRQVLEKDRMSFHLHVKDEEHRVGQLQHNLEIDYKKLDDKQKTLNSTLHAIELRETALASKEKDLETFEERLTTWQEHLRDFGERFAEELKGIVRQ